MSNVKTLIEEWSVRDLEDGSALTVTVVGFTELGNESKAGIQISYMGNIINYEPVAAERWAYEAGKANVDEYLLNDKSWTVYENQYVKTYFVPGSIPRAKIAVKTRSSKPVIKEYPLPFNF